MSAQYPGFDENFRCGFVALVGRPNVGKSTLLNRLLGQKISITAHKPQTTRHKILGIKTSDQAQVIYVDTPGVQYRHKKAINKYMNKEALHTLQDVDVIVLLVDRLQLSEVEQGILKQAASANVPLILVINKMDKIADKAKLLPFLQQLQHQGINFAAVVPMSARSGDAVEAFEKEVMEHLPKSAPFFPQEQLTDRNERFLAAEFIREKFMRSMGEELPYELTVEIEQFKQEGNTRHIHAVIWVERDGQKAIIIGKQGQQLKRIGEAARKDMEAMFDSKVFLQLWVKVKQGWSDDERALRSLGYRDDT